MWNNNIKFRPVFDERKSTEEIRLQAQHILVHLGRATNKPITNPNLALLPVPEIDEEEEKLDAMVEVLDNIEKLDKNELEIVDKAIDEDIEHKLN